MDDLIASLVTGLDEDEKWAKQAASVAGPDWDWKTEVPEGRDYPTDYITGAGALLLDTLGGIEGEAPHVARHDPARVLREVAAKRAILGRHQPRRLDRWLVCSNCRPVDPGHPGDSTSVPWPCPDIRDLAAIYSPVPPDAVDRK